jgi:hypothetical protein
MKIALVIAVSIIAVLVGAAMLSPPPDNTSGKAVEGLPWQIEVLPEGNSKVSGLVLGVATLADVRKRFGTDMEVAIVAAPGESGNVEAFYQDVTLGAVSGKLLVTADIDDTHTTQMAQRAVKVDYMQSSTKKWTLTQDDLATVYAAQIRTLTFIPTANLDEQVVLMRFGKPAERIRISEHKEHFLYPDRGLDLILDDEGKEVLQYVAPKQFARLRDPLVAKPAPTPSQAQQ